MVSASQFTLTRVHTAIYTSPNAFSPSQLLATVLARFGDRYNGAMQVLPEVQHAASDLPPADEAMFPQVIMQSTDGFWRLLAFSNRVDSFWEGRGETQPSSNVVTQCSEVLTHYMQEHNVHARRLALAFSRMCHEDAPSQLLIDRFCNQSSSDRLFRNAEDFEIHSHKRYRPAALNNDIHSWVRCRSARLRMPPQQPLIVVDQDLNTAEAEGYSFNVSAAQAYFLSATIEADTILRLYFPDTIEE